MKCPKCVEECKEDDKSWCHPLSTEEKQDYNIRTIVRTHQRLGHMMVLIGGFYRCQNNHTIEADPADTMRAAGSPRLL